jgi:hypothetical protein
MKKVLLSLAAAMTVAWILGCGGGSGSAGGSGGGTGGGPGGQAPPPGLYVELRGVSRSGFVDPLSLQVGDILQAVVANYDPAGVRTEVAAGAWSCTAPPSFISVTASGRIQVLNRTAGLTSLSTRVTLPGQTRTVQTDLAVPTQNGTTVSGFVREEASTTGVKYVQVEFYSPGGERVAGVRTGDNGRFQALVPNNVVSVSLKGATIPVPKFFRTILYNLDTYPVDTATCAVKLAAIKPGQDNAVPRPLFLIRQSGGPPPPPTGCF